MLVFISHTCNRFDSEKSNILFFKTKRFPIKQSANLDNPTLNYMVDRNSYLLALAEFVVDRQTWPAGNWIPKSGLTFWSENRTAVHPDLTDLLSKSTPSPKNNQRIISDSWGILSSEIFAMCSGQQTFWAILIKKIYLTFINFLYCFFCLFCWGFLLGFFCRSCLNLIFFHPARTLFPFICENDSALLLCLLRELLVPC